MTSIEGWFKQIGSPGRVERQMFITKGGMYYVWYHGAWRFWYESPGVADFISRIIKSDLAKFGLTEGRIKNTHRMLSIRVCLDPADYAYHQLTCKRLSFKVARDKRDDRIARLKKFRVGSVK